MQSASNLMKLLLSEKCWFNCIDKRCDSSGWRCCVAEMSLIFLRLLRKYQSVSVMLLLYSHTLIICSTCKLHVAITVIKWHVKNDSVHMENLNYNLLLTQFVTQFRINIDKSFDRNKKRRSNWYRFIHNNTITLIKQIHKIWTVVEEVFQKVKSHPFKILPK